MTDTILGAKASVIVYSLTETAKVNSLKPYEYLKYLLEEIPEHTYDKNTDFIKRLLLWTYFVCLGKVNDR